MRKVIQRSTMCKFLHDARQRDYVVILKLWDIKLVIDFELFFKNENYLPTVRPQKAKVRGPKARGPRHMPDLPYGKSGPAYSHQTLMFFYLKLTKSNERTKTAKRSLFVSDPSRSDRDRRARLNINKNMVLITIRSLSIIIN